MTKQISQQIHFNNSWLNPYILSRHNCIVRVPVAQLLSRPPEVLNRSINREWVNGIKAQLHKGPFVTTIILVTTLDDREYVGNIF